MWSRDKVTVAYWVGNIQDQSYENINAHKNAFKMFIETTHAETSSM